MKLTRDQLLLRTEFQAPGQATTVLLEDYREVDGLKIPHTIRRDNPALSLVNKIQQVTHNVPIDDSKFVKP